jgi:hypothetical protein
MEDHRVQMRSHVSQNAAHWFPQTPTFVIVTKLMPNSSVRRENTACSRLMCKLFSWGFVRLPIDTSRFGRSSTVSKRKRVTGLSFHNTHTQESELARAPNPMGNHNKLWGKAHGEQHMFFQAREPPSSPSQGALAKSLLLFIEQRTCLSHPVQWHKQE